MSKQLVPSYAFSAAARTVTLTDFDVVALERVLLITNVTRGVIIYSFPDPTLGAAAAGNVLTLAADTTAMADADKLQIIYDPLPPDPQYDRVIVGNARSKFRDGFDGVGLDSTVWDSTIGAGHLLSAGGNSFGSSYLRISMSPFVAASEVVLTSRRVFRFPFRAGFGLSLSQRIVGQEVFIGLVGVDPVTRVVETGAPPADLVITAVAVTVTNVAAFTVANHGLVGGDRVVIYGCAERRLNVGPVVVTIVDKNTFTVPVSLAIGAYSAAGGQIRVSDPFRGASNGLGLLFENATATNASFVSRRSGGKFRSLNSIVATSVAAQSSLSPYTDAFNAAAVHELFAAMDEVSFRSFTTDGIATMSGLGKFSQAIPDEGREYKMQIRARNLIGTSVPVARVLTVVKTGTTTATVTTDAAHGLAVGDWVQVIGVRDQGNFPSMTVATVVASVSSATVFTIVLGTATTTSSVDGVVYRNEGSVLASVLPQAVQSVSRSNGVLTVVGNGTWVTPLPGEFMHLYGLEPGSVALEGPYKVLRVLTTALELDAPGPDVASVPTGGAVIRRTDVRLHFARVLDYTRHVVEVQGGRGNTTDINNAVPVAIAGGSASTLQSTGTSSTQWSAAGWGGFLVNDIVSAALGLGTVTSAAISPGSVVNVGTYAHSFAVIVTAVAGTAPTLDVSVEESPDNGINWVRIFDFQRITAAGAYVSPLIPATWGTRYRYVRTVGGTVTPTVTHAVNRLQFSAPADSYNQFIDRSVVLTTLNATTPAWFVDRARLFVATLTLLAAATPPVLTLEGSEDNVNWYALPGGTLTGVASATVMVYVTGCAPKFARARVSTIGVTVAAGWSLTLKGLE